MIPVYATRADGWPLCPMCHEDELWSPFAWDGTDPKPPMQAWIDAGLRCYACLWERDGNPAPWPWEGRRSKRLPQCARCGEYELPGTMHVCMDVLAQMTTQNGSPYPQGGTPAGYVPPAPAPPVAPAAIDDIQSMPKPNPTRFRVRFGVCYCIVCDLAVTYCKGHGPPDAMSQDAARADRSLSARINDCKGK